MGISKSLQAVWWVIQLVQQGASSKEIARTLQVASKTVEAHRFNILKKLKLKSTTALVDFIQNNGLGVEELRG